jgi:hypothetical protein
VHYADIGFTVSAHGVRPTRARRSLPHALMKSWSDYVRLALETCLPSARRIAVYSAASSAAGCTSSSPAPPLPASSHPSLACALNLSPACPAFHAIGKCVASITYVVRSLFDRFRPPVRSTRT